MYQYQYKSSAMSLRYKQAVSKAWNFDLLFFKDSRLKVNLNICGSHFNHFSGRTVHLVTVYSSKKIVSRMEEPGEQCTVVFALIITEPTSKCVGVLLNPGGGHTVP